jgi:hypothetical protein
MFAEVNCLEGKEPMSAVGSFVEAPTPSPCRNDQLLVRGKCRTVYRRKSKTPEKKDYLVV